MSVRNTEKLIKSLKNPDNKKKKRIISVDFSSEKITKTEKKLETKVDFVFNENNSGKIILNFKSKTDFHRILKKINE